MGIERRKKKRKKICSFLLTAATLFVPVGIFCLCFFFRYSFFVVQCPCEYVPDVRSVCSFKHLLLHSCLSQRGFFFIIICCWSSGEMHILACIVHIHQKHTSLIYDGNIFLDRPCFYYYYSSYTVLPWWFRMRKTDNAIILLHSVVSHTLKKKKKAAQSLLRSCVAPFFYSLLVFVTQSCVTVDISSLKPACLLFLFCTFCRICVSPFGFKHCSLAPAEERMHCADTTVRSGMHFAPDVVAQITRGQLLCEACNRRMPVSFRPHQCHSVCRCSLQVLVISPPRRSLPTWQQVAPEVENPVIFLVAFSTTKGLVWGDDTSMSWMYRFTPRVLLSFSFLSTPVCARKHVPRVTSPTSCTPARKTPVIVCSGEK